MATYRQIHIKIWFDTWFNRLSPTEKLHFVYLFSNPATSVSGIYELPPEKQAFETGIPLQEINKNLDNFQKDGKLVFDSDKSVVWIIAMRKYNANPSPKVQKKIKSDVRQVPDCDVKKAYCEHYDLDYDTLSDTLSVEYVNGIDRGSTEQEQEQENYNNRKDKQTAWY